MPILSAIYWVVGCLFFWALDSPRGGRIGLVSAVLLATFWPVTVLVAVVAVASVAVKLLFFKAR
jgi:hypothetical protein